MPVNIYSHLGCKRLYPFQNGDIIIFNPQDRTIRIIAFGPDRQKNKVYWWKPNGPHRIKKSFIKDKTNFHSWIADQAKIFGFIYHQFTEDIIEKEIAYHLFEKK